MSETQTTRDRIANLVGDAIDWDWETLDTKAVDAIAAEIDALHARLAREQAATGELSHRLAEARAEVERLRPAAEAWRTLEAARKEERTGTDENEHAEYWVHILARNAARAAARARAAKEAKA